MALDGGETERSAPEMEIGSLGGDGLDGEDA